MQIPKALEILQLAISDPDLVDTIDLLDAHTTAIQALQLLDSSIIYINHRRLPNAKLTITTTQLTAYPILFNQHVRPASISGVLPDDPGPKSSEQPPSAPGRSK